jgi:hypothetical protein
VNAYRFVAFPHPPRVEDAPDPAPGAGQVVVRVAGGCLKAGTLRGRAVITPEGEVRTRP